MKRKALLLTSLTLVIGAAIGALGVTTYAAFQSKVKTNRQTTVCRMVYLETHNVWARNDDTGDHSTWKRYSAWVWNDEEGSGEFANHATFMERVSQGLYRIPIPTGFTHIIFVWHTDKSTSVDWSTKVDGADSSQTVDMDLSSSWNKFVLWDDTSSMSVAEGHYKKSGSKRGGIWENTDATNTYSYTHP